MGAGRSGRAGARGGGAVEQPNLVAPADVPSLSARLWLLVVATGVLAGLAGAALMVLLHAAAQLTYGQGRGVFRPRSNGRARAAGWWPWPSPGWWPGPAGGCCGGGRGPAVRR
ncbi:hypothetical protein GCM10017688_59680 [Streptomyces ramulosus]